MSIYVATGCHGQVRSTYTSCVVRTMLLLNSKMECAYDLYHGTSEISHARNSMARRFLATPMEYMLSIDADQAWMPSEVVRMYETAKEYDTDILAGVYCTSDGRNIQMATVSDPRVKKGPLVNLDACGAGFSLIHRRVFERLVDHVESYECPDGETHNWYPIGIQDGELVGEDYGFCRLVTSHGMTIWALSDLVVGHCAKPQLAFEFRLGDHLNSKPVTM